MPICTTTSTVVERFTLVVPRAAGHAEDYLRDVVRDLRECRVPVTLLRESVVAPVLPVGRAEGIVAVPTTAGTGTLSGLVCAHVAWDAGDDLGVGWFLVDETERGAADRDIVTALSLAQAAHACAVAPAVRRVEEARNRRVDPQPRSAARD